MEFKAIVDAKARATAGCAVVGVYEKGTWAWRPGISTSSRRLIARLHAGGRFRGQARRDAAAASPARRAAQRAAADRPRAARRIRAQAIPQGLAIERAGRAQDGLGRRNRVSGASRTFPAWRRHIARVQSPEVFSGQMYKIPDLKTAPKAKPPKLASLTVAADNARSAKAMTDRRQDRRCHRRGQRVRPRSRPTCRPISARRLISAQRALGSWPEWPRIKTKVLDEAAIKSLKMGAFLAVTQGSAQPPRFIVCEYRGAKKDSAPICLIGKGITFDSGGISLKEPPGMDEMKFDMSGAATVLGALRAAAELKLPDQRHRHRRRLREHAERQRGEARRHRHIHVRPDGGNPEHRRRGAARSVRRHDLQPALQAGRGHRCRDADRRLHHRARQSDLRLDEQRPKRSPRSCSPRARAPTIGRGACPSARNMPISSRATSRISPMSADARAAPCTAATYLSKFAKDLVWAHLDVAGTAWVGGSQKSSTGRPVPLLTDFLLHRAARVR